MIYALDLRTQTEPARLTVKAAIGGSTMASFAAAAAVRTECDVADKSGQALAELSGGLTAVKSGLSKQLAEAAMLMIEVIVDFVAANAG